ncbi:unnamed protein product [Mytilus coruscus]|uniref:Uncharacterized protein n=1 Tax=Mytilus coruscus TaxID=42192 RepID=A0A6J8EHU7_MYTCO|nr:unnamed protein product [Mytilus coruscus]
MDVADLVSELKSSIHRKDEVKVRNILGPIKDLAVVRSIDEKFYNTYNNIDPVNFAIECGAEKIAIYLVEKSFPTDRLYQQELVQCDQWCYFDHGNDRCPAMYDAADNAINAYMHKLKNIIQAIREGKHKPGEGITSPYIEETVKSESEKMEPVKQEKPGMPIFTLHKETAVEEAKKVIDNYGKNYVSKDGNTLFHCYITKPKVYFYVFAAAGVPVNIQNCPECQFSHYIKETAVEEAKKVIDNWGKNYVSKDGNTLFHCYITKPKVYFYVFAAAGVPVNIQNCDGDTALHMAVRAASVDAAEALLQCCADPMIRNKMGQTPIDMSDNETITKLLNKFKPGVVSAICNDKAQTLDRVLKNTWCCTDCVVKEGKTAIELAETKVYEGKSEKCLSVLKSYRKTSQLIHAVLCHDVETTRKLLEREKLPVNIRFRDRIGKTLLSHCIEQHNTELVRLLVEHGARINQIRVRLHEDTDVTIPLFHKCLLDNDCLDIAKFLNPQMDPAEHKEKDQAGNTAVLAAIEKGLSVRYIQWLIQVTRGSALVDRNADGLTPKELATAKNNTEVVKMIDKYIIQNVVQESGIPTLLLPQFAINFCCEEDITRITDEKTKKTLIELLQDSNDKYNMKKWLNFKEVGNYAEKIMRAASGGDIFEKEIRMKSSDGGLSYIKEKYDANYRDRNGFTAMTRAIVFHKFDIIEYLCTTRPMLKTLPDNFNRYPLHYAYALPEPESERVRKLLLEKNPQDIEKRVDKDGLYPADYAAFRDSLKVQQILYDARTLNVYAQRGPPLGRWPVGALKDPPEEE